MEAQDTAMTVTAILAAVTGIGMALRWIRKRWCQIETFLADWQGYPARPGVAPKPGALERLALIEAELRPNHGTSMRDAIDRVEHQLHTHLDNHAKQVQQTRQDT